MEETGESMADDANSKGTPSESSSGRTIPKEDWQKAIAKGRRWGANFRGNPFWRVRGITFVAALLFLLATGERSFARFEATEGARRTCLVKAEFVFVGRFSSEKRSVVRNQLNALFKERHTRYRILAKRTRFDERDGGLHFSYIGICANGFQRFDRIFRAFRKIVPELTGSKWYSESMHPIEIKEILESEAE